MQILDIKDQSTMTIVIQALTCGELVIYPTETCYGIAVDTTNPDAIAKLLEYKGDRHRQVAVAVSNRNMAEQYVEINEIASNLYSHFLPGPITVISNSKHVLDSRLESEQGTLGVRLPNYDFALRLIESFGKPITATSGNTSGKKEPYSLADWQKYTTSEKQQMVSIFVDAGKLQNRPTSTVVDTSLNEPMILRQGEIVVANIKGQSFTSKSVEKTKVIAQDILKKHLSLTNRYPLIFALQGPLGVGKTHFTQGLASLLGIIDNVNSPTFTLMKEYPFACSGTVHPRSDLNLGTVPDRNSRLQVEKGSTAVEGTVPNVDFKYSGVLYHLDTWRLDNSHELESTLHFSTLLKPGNIIVLEWPQKAQKILTQYKDSCAIIYIDISETSETSRQIKYQLSIPEWS
ncbi:MAG: L-threonylcarbamoyladenylate synthase [bacterium]